MLTKQKTKIKFKKPRLKAKRDIGSPQSSGQQTAFSVNVSTGLEQLGQKPQKAFQLTDKRIQGWPDGSLDKGAYHQAWGPQLNPQDSQNGRKEPTLKLSFDLYLCAVDAGTTYMRACAHAHVHTHTILYVLGFLFILR